MPKKRGEKILLLISIALASWMLGGVGNAQASTEISTDINSATTWTAQDSPYIVSDIINVNAPLVIEPGTVIKFSNALFPSKNFPGAYHRSALVLHSSFSAIGKSLDEVVFTSVCDYSHGGDTSSYCSLSSKLGSESASWAGIYAENSMDKISISYAKILYANTGLSYSNTDQKIHRSLSLTYSEIRYCQEAGLYIRGAEPLLNNLILADNYYGIELYGLQYSTSKYPTIRNSAIFNNRKGVYDGYYGGIAKLDARYNWWGDPSGPYFNFSTSVEAKNTQGLGNSINSNNTLFRPWAQSDPTIPKQPVIFIPGIGASLNPDLMISGVLSDNWTMFDHTYDGILSAFKVMGYKEGENFFIAYYDWRESNVESAKKYLQPLIEKALSQSGANSVNIVTHSMGSLVARSYVQSDDYQGDVDKLIMIAPPNKGSSDVYTAWEGGYIPNNWSSKVIMKAYLDYLQIKNVTLNKYETIHRYVPSLGELMPIYDYLQSSDDKENLKGYYSMHEQNEFLRDLSTGANVLNMRTNLSIILGDNQPTVNKIPIIESDKLGLWIDGKPDPIDPMPNDSHGDGEVLISSGDSPNNYQAILDYGHREIVSKSEKIVAERLNEHLDWTFDSPRIDDEMIVWTDAPADMQITDPDGNIVSKESNEIADAIYSQEKNKDGFKIVSIPNIKKGDYKVSLKGHDDGQYHVSVGYSDHTGDNLDKSETQIVGVQKDQDHELIIPTDPDNGVDPISDPVLLDMTAPTITLESPKDGEEYANDQILPITFSYSDDISKQENITIEKYLDDMLLDGDSIDLSQLSLGEHDFWINAYDEAENVNMAEAYFKVKEPEPLDDSDPPPVVDPPVVDPPPVDPSDDGDPSIGDDGQTDNGDVAQGDDPGDTSDTDSGDAGDVAPVVDPPVITPPAQTVVVEENTDQNNDSHKSKDNKKKSSKKSKKKSSGGVTKSDEEIRIISSTEKTRINYYDFENQGEQDVLGAEDEKMPRDEEILPGKAFEISNQQPIFNVEFETTQRRCLFRVLSEDNDKLSSLLGKIYWRNNNFGKGQFANASEQRSEIDKNAEKSRFVLLFEMILALFLAIFFVTHKSSKKGKKGK